ncbi:MAG TPA: hypothetical protein VEL28_19855 [Candidatus Binatia bacterium]|nr:hypothetical protein [Candidatus Binatia bacterium]
MKNTTPSPGPGSDDGVRIIEKSRDRRVTMVEAVAGCIVVAGIVIAAASFGGGDEASPPIAGHAKDPSERAMHRGEPAAPAQADAKAATARPRPGPRLPAARRRSQTPPLPNEAGDAAAAQAAGRAPIPPSREGDAREYIEALRAAGETGGIAAYPPPGSSPPLSGNVVPEDYALPEGYVRHYQSTDGGKQLEPILMFSPDYDFFDENGNPVPIPKNRVVPPEMVPPDLPLRTLDVPQTPADGMP